VPAAIWPDTAGEVERSWTGPRRCGAERGFQEAISDDDRRLAEGLAAELCTIELSPYHLRDDPLARFSQESIEPRDPPGGGDPRRGPLAVRATVHRP
jgi:hypothetical protein